MTKLATGLPEGDGNGLASITRQLIDHPHQIHVAVVFIDCSKQTVNTDTGQVDPTARIRRIEPITGQDKELAATMMRRALEERTGQTVLPMDLEEDLAAVFEGIDPQTGEILNRSDDSTDTDESGEGGESE